MQCRLCGHPVTYSVANLGLSPLANNFIPSGCENKEEVFYPLHAFVCEKCFLVQLEEFQSAEKIFTDYAYFSSYSQAWLEHCKTYANRIIQTIKLNGDSLVVEIASNDGYMLQYFKKENIPVLGIEPAENIAKVAQSKGIETVTDFFGEQLAKKLVTKGRYADLLIGNNVLAHVPNLNDFVAGLPILLSKDGIITMEFPHLLNLLEQNQFDTIYHEHFSYFSLFTVCQLFLAHGLRVFDVETLPTHGGSIRVYACHENNRRPTSINVNSLLHIENLHGLKNLQTYSTFEKRIQKTKREILKFLIEGKEKNLSTVAYGAPAKGNTLLNYCGISTDLIDFTVDKSPYKQNTYLPGSRIPVFSVDNLLREKPDRIIILPWNLKHEILAQLKPFLNWETELYTFIPEVNKL